MKLTAAGQVMPPRPKPKREPIALRPLKSSPNSEWVVGAWRWDPKRVRWTWQRGHWREEPNFPEPLMGLTLKEAMFLLEAVDAVAHVVTELGSAFVESAETQEVRAFRETILRNVEKLKARTG